MNTHTHHGLMVSGGAHALVVALLVLASLARSPQVERPVGGVMQIVSWPAGASGEKRDEELAPASKRNLFQPPTPPPPVKSATPAVEAGETRETVSASPVKAPVARPATVVKTSPSPTRGPRTASPPRPTREMATTVPRVNVAEIVGALRPGRSATEEGEGRRLPSGADAEALASYYQLIKQRVLAAFEQPVGTPDGLVAGVAFRISAQGGLSGVRITKASGNPAFDAAVLAAFARARLPEKPDGRGEELELAFRTEELGAR